MKEKQEAGEWKDSNSSSSSMIKAHLQGVLLEFLSAETIQIATREHPLVRGEFSGSSFFYRSLFFSPFTSLPPSLSLFHTLFQTYINTHLYLVSFSVCHDTLDLSRMPAN